MIETAISLSAGKVSGAEIEKIIRLGKEMLAHPIELLPFVYEAVDALEDHYHLLIVTKGDLFDQENKIARSGLADRFRTVEIVSEKSTATYADILRRHAIPPERFLMIGNSLKSDVLPVVAAGGRAVYLPYAFTWRQEQVAVAETNEHWCTAESMEWIVAQLMAAGTGRVFR